MADGKNMTTIAIVQARMASTRFPGKVMSTVTEIPLIELLLHRLSQARKLNKIILATSTNPNNRPLVDHVRKLQYAVYQGSEDDVLDRYYKISVSEKANVIVRITGDCPLVDPRVVDSVITKFERDNSDYTSNIDPPTFPDGLDVEIFTFAALKDAWKCAVSSHDREHVTSYIRNVRSNCVTNLKHSVDYSNERWTVDEPEDLDVIRDVFQHFSPRIDFTWSEILNFAQEQPETFSPNRHLVRNDGSKSGTGQKLWGRAKRIIPGGSMLVSKRSEMFLPENWPAYYSKSSGCTVWDLDDNLYIDMSIMSAGTNLLGYGRQEVDEAVRKAITMGNMSTLNCPEEVYLAEKLVELHPWADMVRFARTGGEANAIAVRIARAASGKTNVAVCGYHGWHDWYLAANLGGGDDLSGHLLSGLEPNGVPSGLKDSIYTFNYNDFDELSRLVDTHNIGIIKMEVARSIIPNTDFLKNIRLLADDKEIVLIFDECTSGFRGTLGGLHKLYGIEPDMAIFGKALGNGYAITAIIGRRSLMEAAQTSFISSTFWTERIGSVAGLTTLEIMEKEKSWKQVTEIGSRITTGWERLATNHGISITTTGLPALPGFSFTGPKALAYKTLITQEMLPKGYLASTNVYVCTEHSPQIISDYLDALDSVFSLIRLCEDGEDVASFLVGDICHDNFRRLN